MNPLLLRCVPLGLAPLRSTFLVIALGPSRDMRMLQGERQAQRCEQQANHIARRIFIEHSRSIESPPVLKADVLLPTAYLGGSKWCSGNTSAWLSPGCGYESCCSQKRKKRTLGRPLHRRCPNNLTGSQWKTGDVKLN